MITHAQYHATHPLPVCNTIIPKPRRKVEVCQIAVRKATRAVRNTDIGEYVPNPRVELARAETAQLFSKLKDMGQLNASEIADILHIRRANVVGRAESLVATGEMIKTKISARDVVYEWRDGAQGVRKIERPMRQSAARFKWMAGKGWLYFRQIADKMHVRLTTVREQMSRLEEDGTVEKKLDGCKKMVRWIG